MYLYTYYTKASLILTDVFICYVEIYIYFGGKHCIYAVIDIQLNYIYEYEEKIQIYHGGIKIVL